jgi:hypothetical protein
MDKYLKWNSFTVGEQLINVGMEVSRAIKFKNKNNTQGMYDFYNKATELLQRSKVDPKNKYRIVELDLFSEQLFDYFIGDNIYNNDDVSIMKFTNEFI